MTEPALPHPPTSSIAGGGVAALEAMIALHDLAGDRVRVTLAHAPVAFRLPAALGRRAVLPRPCARHSLVALARDFDADLVAGRDHRGRCAAEPRAARRRRRTLDVRLAARRRRRRHASRRSPMGSRSGRTAPPRRSRGCSPTSRTASPARGVRAADERCLEPAAVRARADDGPRRRGPPALDAVELTLVTPETRPLEVFGREASRDGRRAARAGAASSSSARPPPEVRRGDGDRRRPPDRCRPHRRHAGARRPRRRGLPADDAGFIPVDEHGRVDGRRWRLRGRRRDRLPDQAGRPGGATGCRGRRDDRCPPRRRHRSRTRSDRCCAAGCSPAATTAGCALPRAALRPQSQRRCRRCGGRREDRDALPAP